MALVVKSLSDNVGDLRHRFDPWVGKIAWRREFLPTLVFLPGGSHGQRSLVGFSPGGHQELDTDDCFHFERLLFKDRLPRKEIYIP